MNAVLTVVLTRSVAVPSCVEPDEQNTASSMMAAFLGLGLCLGAMLSNVTIKII